MKMPGPNRIIVIYRSLQNAYHYDQLAVKNMVRDLDLAEHELDYDLMQNQDSRALRQAPPR